MSRGRPLLLALLLATSACDSCDLRPPQERRLAEYVTAIDPDAGPAPPLESNLQRLPAHPQRSRDIARRTTNISGFLTLQRCALGERIGLRNSVLGRVMLGSQLWVYEAGFLRDVDTCLPGLDLETRAALELVAAGKREDLPSIVWNATWGGPELPHLLALSGRDLDPGAGTTASAATVALGLLRAHVNDPLTVDSPGLEGALKILRESTVGGDLLRTLDLLRHNLDLAADRLEHLAADPPCARLRDVFEHRYARDVQPYLARTHAAAAPLLTALDGLYHATADPLPAVSPELAAYAQAQLDLTAPDGLWRRYNAALRRHTAAWQQVATHCGFLPTAD